MGPEWEVASYKNLIAISQGYPFKSEQFSNDVASGPPLIRIRDLKTQRPEIFINGEIPEGYNVSNNDILIGMDGEFIAVRWKGPSSLLNQRICSVKSANKYFLDDAFLYYTLQPELDRIHNSTGHTTVKHLSAKSVLAITRPLPPLPEQRKIAAILSSVDDAIEKSSAVIYQLEVVKKALMQELLTRGLPGRHTRFKQTEIGEIPEEWEVVPLGNIAKIRGGKRMPKGRPFADHPTPHPYIRVSDLFDGTILQDEIQYVLPIDREQIKAYTISKNDLYISIAGTLGLVGEVPDDLDGAQLTENAAKICEISVERVQKIFLMYALQSDNYIAQLERLKGVGSGVPKLALFRIESIAVPLPSINEQFIISKNIESVFLLIRSERAVRECLMKVKDGLLKLLLSGEVRVSIDKDAA